LHNPPEDKAPGIDINILIYDISLEMTFKKTSRRHPAPDSRGVMTLRWKEIAGPQEAWHLVRVVYGRNIFPRLHRHDFPEIFWINEGECIHRINGSDLRLRTGDIVFIRPDDIHQILPASRGGFTFTNLAFSLEILRSLKERFPAELENVLPEKRELPFARPLGRLEARLDEEARQLSVSPHSRFYAERFLLNLIALLTPLRALTDPGGGPDWLHAACLALRQPEIFSEGVSGLVRAAGRSPEHVARSARQHLGKTPGELVTAARMDFAAKELRLTSKSVIEIGFDCGYAKPSRFFEVFRRHHGTSPLRYRKQQQLVV
jgi:AraC family cel operon transcriptional repressor